MALPELSPDQRAAAVEKQHAARAARQQLIAQLAAGQMTISQALDRGKSDEVVAKTRVSALVRALPGYGPARAATVMTAASITRTRRVGNLGTRQREALLTELTQHPERAVCGPR